MGIVSSKGASATVRLAVVDGVPHVKVLPESVSQAKPVLAPVTGTGVWTISPKLPAGLWMDPDTRLIECVAGMYMDPEEFVLTQGSRSYQARISTTAGVVNVEILHEVSQDAVVAPWSPTPSAPAPSAPLAGTWSIEPTLPVGMSMDPNTGLIKGVPGLNIKAHEYTITNANGSAVLSMVVANGIPEVQFVSEAAGGQISSSLSRWTIEPPLPTGLNMDLDTGVIHCEAGMHMEPREFVITGNNVPARVMLSVDNGLPRVQFLSKDTEWISGDKLTEDPQAEPKWSVTPSLSEGLKFDTDTGVISGLPTESEPKWSVTPSLPEGLKFDTDTGVISGLPTESGEMTQFIVSDSDKAASLNLQVGTADPTPPTGTWITADEVVKHFVKDEGTNTWSGHFQFPLQATPEKKKKKGAKPDAKDITKHMKQASL